jgi:hypothetical protein
LEGVDRAGFEILRNDFGGFVFEKKERKRFSPRRKDAKGTGWRG